MNLVKSARLIRDRPDLETSRRGVRACGGSPGFGRLQPTAGEIERVPPEAQTVQACQDSRQNRRRDQRPAQRRQGPRKQRGPHGNTRRSSSKWGPSLRRVQSPPQTIAVP